MSYRYADLDGKFEEIRRRLVELGEQLGGIVAKLEELDTRLARLEAMTARRKKKLGKAGGEQ